MGQRRSRGRALARHVAASAGAAILLGSVGACATSTGGRIVAPDQVADTLAPGAGVPLPSRLPTGVAPTATPVPTRVVAPDDPLTLPPGFGVGAFATDLAGVESLAIAPSGEVFASVPAANKILVLVDRNGDAVAEDVVTYAAGEPLNEPHGIAFWGDWLYVADTDGVLRYPYLRGDLAAWRPPEFLVPLAGGGDHSSRGLAFGPDGRMYVSVGASCNMCVDPDPRRATILRFDPDGGDPSVYALGLRDAVGLAFDPLNGQLWASECGRDGMGDSLPPDELNWIVAGNSYGWPYCVGQKFPEPALGNDPRLCENTRGPSVELAPHSVPRGMMFYGGTQFPSEYRGDLFIAMEGALEYRTGAGFRVARVPFENGRPTGAAADFVTGFLWSDLVPWGRPYGLAMAPDGSLLISDGHGGRIYRVFYAGIASTTPQPDPTLTATPLPGTAR